MLPFAWFYIILLLDFCVLHRSWHLTSQSFYKPNQVLNATLYEHCIHKQYNNNNNNNNHHLSKTCMPSQKTIELCLLYWEKAKMKSPVRHTHTHIHGLLIKWINVLLLFSTTTPIKFRWKASNLNHVHYYVSLHIIMLFLLPHFWCAATNTLAPTYNFLHFPISCNFFFIIYTIIARQVL